MNRKIVCIDLDGTLIHYEEWKGEEHFGRVLPGASAATKTLHEKGWYIIIYTTRANKSILKKFLSANKIEFDAINENPYQPMNALGGKPLADIYIDDRALCFKGNWEQTIKEISHFKSWEEMGKQETDNSQYPKQLLINDFQQAFYMLRHYDDINWNLTKFSFGQTLVSLGACWTIFFEANKPDALPILKSYYSLGIFVLLILSAAFTLISILGICKNRTYFVKVSRYINEHRSFALMNDNIDFANVSRMWSDPQFPKKLDCGSTQMICLYLLCSCYLLEFILAGIIFPDVHFCYSKVVGAIVLIALGVLICGFSIWKSLKD